MAKTEAQKMLERIRKALKEGRNNRKALVHRSLTLVDAAGLNAHRSGDDPRQREWAVQRRSDAEKSFFVDPWESTTSAMERKLKEKRPSVRAAKKARKDSAPGLEL